MYLLGLGLVFILIMEAPLENYVNEVARSSTSSLIGSQWLSSYIDPAHGNAYVFPDEDTTYSAAIRTKNIQAINKAFFVSSDYTGPTPDILNFMVFSMPSPDSPIVVAGDFYYMKDKTTVKERRCVVLSDVQYTGYIDEILQSRLIYKGFTLSYTGNAFDNQGFMSASTYNPSFGVGALNQQVNVENTANQTFLDCQYLPMSSRQVANMNRDFEIFATSEGVYGVHKFNGSRSEYTNVGDNEGKFFFGCEVGASTGLAGYRWRSYADRFMPPTNMDEKVSPYSMKVECLNNWNVVCVAVDGMSANQSLLLKYYQGSQVHFKPNSSLVAMQTYKGFLDNAALTAASQLNSTLSCVYPSSYNDFRAIWSKIRNFLKSSNGRNLVGAITSAVGPYGSLINAAYGLL